MFVVKNAWKSVTRNKGRNMLIIVIVTIIAAAATIGLSIRQAAATARSSGLDNTTVTAQISLDRGKLISESREQSKSDSDSSDASAKPDFDAMRSALADKQFSLADYQKMLQDARGHQLISFEDMVEEGDDDYLERHLKDETNEPSKLLEDQNLHSLLAQGIEQLPEREKLMMALYYEQDLNLREIGEVMGVTESRVCQLHSQAVARLRARIFGEGGLKKKAKRHG